jgi:tRNA threonylcarbamoyladenosine biosynthesis protein TsaE
MCGRLRLEGLFMERFISKSPADTENIGKMVGEKINGGTVIAFRGGLGMGKTCFTRGLARGLGSNDTVTSPTFALVNEYLSGRLPLYHFDMYRITGWEDLYSTGFFDYIEAGAVLACEWSENIENALPQDTLFVEFNRIDDLTREIIIRKQGEHL